MTAFEKFKERLKELGLEKNWGGFGRIGKVMEDGYIVILVHESQLDKYSEFRFPPYSFLKECKDFKENLLEMCYEQDWDGESFKKVYEWLNDSADNDADNAPICPEDLYFTADKHITYYHDFTDDYFDKDIKELFDNNTHLKEKYKSIAKKYGNPIYMDIIEGELKDLLRMAKKQAEENCIEKIKKNLLKNI